MASGSSWATDVANNQIRGHPNHFISRPLSIASYRSAGSGTSDISERRRSAILAEADSPLRNSLQRAQDALRASERSRSEEERKLAGRRRVRSTHWAEEPVRDRTTRPESSQDLMHDNDETEELRSSGIRQGPKLHKSRSIPLELLSSPPAQPQQSTPHHHSIEVKRISPPRSSAQPRRVASYGNLLVSPQQQPFSILRTSPAHGIAPAGPVALPEYLPIPNEPASKFSASSGESRADPLASWDASVRARARTLSQATSLKKMIRKTPSKLSLRKKGSLANLLENVSFGSGGKKKEDKAADFKARLSSVDSDEQRPAFISKIPTRLRDSSSTFSSHAAQSSAPSILSSTATNRKTPRSLRGTLKDFAKGTRSNRPESGSVEGSASSKRDSDISSKEGSSGGDKKKSGWVSRLGRVVSGKRVAERVQQFEELPTPVVHLAEKIRVVRDAPVSFPQPSRPSRIPISAVFTNVVVRTAPQPPPSRKPAPHDLDSDDTTFFGHAIPQPAPRSTRPASGSTSRRSSIPVPISTTRASFTLPSRLGPPSAHSLLPSPDIVSSSSYRRTRTPSLVPGGSSDESSSDGVSPPSPSPSRRSFNFRAPSPARFRDLVPSESASSSPEKNAHGLPVPSDGSPKSPGYGASPKKRAMGPENIISMPGVASDDEGIVEARGATTDLAELLSSLDDTTDDIGNISAYIGAVASPRSTTNADLSASLRRHLPRSESSMESLKSIVSDVPDDLQQLIRSVSDEISDVEQRFSQHFDDDFKLERALALEEPDPHRFTDEDEEPFDRTFEDGPFALERHIEPDHSDHEEALDSEDAPCFDTDEDHAPFSPQSFRDHRNSELQAAVETSPSATSTDEPLSSESPTRSLSNGPDSTASSFEGHAWTAAMALRDMLNGPAPPLPSHPRAYLDSQSSEHDDADDEGRSTLRDSVRDYLQMERPTVGEKMMDRMDIEVSLESLLAAQSAPPSPMSIRPSQAATGRGQSTASSFCEVGMGSPTPASGQAFGRHSMVRYSQDRSRRPLHRRRMSTQDDSSESEMDGSAPDEVTSMSLAQSTRSTNLSISSINSSPCPVPRQRRIPMLTRSIPPPPVPNFRFPPTHAAPTTEDRNVKSAYPWTQTHSSTSPIKAKTSTSPFKKSFNPLEQFKARRRGGSASEEDSSGEIPPQVQTSSPRFVRPLQPSATVPRPQLLDSEVFSNALIPPDTPPPSSPSISASDSDRSSRSTVQSHRQSSIIELNDRQHPPVVVLRNKGHARQLSRSSSLIRDTIIEEEDRETYSPVSSPTATPPTFVLDAQAGEELIEPFEEPEPLQMIPESPIKLVEVDVLASRTVELVDDHDDWLRSKKQDDTYFSDGEDDERTQQLVRTWIHFNWEAEEEIRRSRARFPDTDRSREAVARFERLTSTHDVLQFLFASQNRYRSRAYAYPSRESLLGIPSPQLDPSEAASPPTPNLSSDGDATQTLSLSPPSPSPIPGRPHRMVLGPKPVNRQLALTKSTSSPSKAPNDALSPFTALPPKLGFGSKLRGLRAKMSPKKTVDTTFLGTEKGAVSKRRKEQFDAARRRLEGTGLASEQRSDDESDVTGVLEAEGTGSIGFAKTPRLTTNRPRVRRKQALTTLRM